MKKIVACLVMLSFIFPPNVFAAKNPVEKFGRGVVNIVTSPVEIPREVRAHWIKGSEKTYHIIVWIFCGMVYGTAKMTARLASGTWDVVSSPVSVPKDYGPLLKPDYVFEDWPRREEGVVYKNLGDK